jgi:hypothetical protein
MQTAPEKRTGGLQRRTVTFISPDSSAVAPEQANVGWPLRLAIMMSVLALAVSLLDFALIIGTVPMPIPGLRSQDQGNAIDAATYGFELEAQGWMVREAATNAVSNDTHVFAGRGRWNSRWRTLPPPIGLLSTRRSREVPNRTCGSSLMSTYRPERHCSSRPSMFWTRRGYGRTGPSQSSIPDSGPRSRTRFRQMRRILSMS